MMMIISSSTSESHANKKKQRAEETQEARREKKKINESTKIYGNDNGADMNSISSPCKNAAELLLKKKRKQEYLHFQE
jgi:hypothetical protein